MAKFNMATGQDTISASIKHVNEPIKFKSFAKMMFSVNQFPGLPSYDDPNANAFFNRWVGIRFEKMFYDAEAFERKKEMGEENIGLKDPNILNKLATKEELSGLLNFTLEGLQRVKERGWALMELQTMSELKETWKRQGDPANAFFEERVEQGDPEDERYWSPKTGLFERYIDFRNSYNLGSESRQTFYEKVKRRFGSGVKEKQHRLEGKMTRCFDGIRYVDEGEDEENEQSTLC
jgi:phage/plasmid-associated DNA primase